jgi:hypothetical protein
MASSMTSARVRCSAGRFHRGGQGARFEHVSGVVKGDVAVLYTLFTCTRAAPPVLQLRLRTMAEKLSQRE